MLDSFSHRNTFELLLNAADSREFKFYQWTFLIFLKLICSHPAAVAELSVISMPLPKRFLLLLNG